MDKEGLKISKNVIIKRISGPVKMVYLKPNKYGTDVLKTLYNVDLPVILLFGDRHKNDAGMCLNTGCVLSDDDKECSYNIYDEEFLKHIDNLGKDYPVDFFTEYSYDHNKLRSNEILFGKFEDKVSKCHDVKLRKENSELYERECPTKYIRWHYADTRFFSNSIEGYMFEPIFNFFSQYKLIETQRNISSVSSRIYKFKTVDKKLRKDGHIFILNFYKTLINNLDSKYDDIIDKLVVLFFEFINSYGRKSALYKQMIMNTDLKWDQILKVVFNTNVRSSYEGYINYLKMVKKGGREDVFDVIFEKMNVSEEELESANLPPLPRLVEPRVDANGKVYYVDFVNKTTSWERPMIPDENIVKNLNVYKHVLRTLYLIYMDFGTNLVDLYFISRMLKKPSNGINAPLVISYFGVYHTNNIADILEIIFSYDRIDIDSDETKERCITINKSINLIDDVKDRIKTIENFEINNKKLYLDQFDEYKFEAKTTRRTRKSKRRATRKTTRKSTKRGENKSARKSVRKSKIKSRKTKRKTTLKTKRKTKKSKR